jgi:hypothetical protein
LFHHHRLACSNEHASHRRCVRARRRCCRRRPPPWRPSAAKNAFARAPARPPSELLLIFRVPHSTHRPLPPPCPPRTPRSLRDALRRCSCRPRRLQRQPRAAGHLGARLELHDR